MKKLLFAFLSLVILFGCAKSSNEKRDVSTYFPFYKNKMYVYTGNGGKFNDQKIYAMYIDENKMQRRIDMGSMVVTQVLENINGQLKCSNVAGDVFHLENMLQDPQTDFFVELQEPFEVGSSWTFSDSTSYKKEITNMNAKVETPYATFDNAMEVTVKLSDDTTKKEYYVPELGFVKSVTESSGETFVIYLSQIINDAAMDLDSVIYTVDDIAENLVADFFELNLKTNDEPAEKILTEMKKNNLVEQNAKINKIELDRTDLQNQIMKLDFNQNFIDLTKFGAQSESLTLQAIVNTFGHIYGVNKIKLTVDGENYESGHISLEDGEYFNVE